MPLKKNIPPPNLEIWYQQYLHQVRLDESTMSPTQRIETKRAFFAGMATMFFKVTEYGKANEATALKALDNIVEQLDKYWKKQ